MPHVCGAVLCCAVAAAAAAAADAAGALCQNTTDRPLGNPLFHNGAEDFGPVCSRKIRAVLKRGRHIARTPDALRMYMYASIRMWMHMCSTR